MPDAFYVPDEEGFASTALTRGPWDDAHQHAGPPAALLARELARCQEPEGRALRRITVEILGPVPIAPLRASARVVRPGRAVELVEGELAGPDGEVMRARGWRLATGAIDLPDGLPRHPPPPGPEAGQPSERFPSPATEGWHTAMEIRYVSGDVLEPGPATAWFRPRHPLVAGEDLDPLARLMLAADASNGISAALDWSRWLFVNVDLTVHITRAPHGEWVCLDAVTYPEPEGIGLARSDLYDEAGLLGLAAQTLVIRPRSA
jgi:acyl-Coa thioesterase superfamily protein/acyl-CoA thioesterase superfamily protein